MLTNAEVQIATVIRTLQEIAGTLKRQACLGRRREVGRTTNESGDTLGDRIHHLTAAITPC